MASRRPSFEWSPLGVPAFLSPILTCVAQSLRRRRRESLSDLKRPGGRKSPLWRVTWGRGSSGMSRTIFQEHRTHATSRAVFPPSTLISRCRSDGVSSQRVCAVVADNVRGFGAVGKLSLRGPQGAFSLHKRRRRASAPSGGTKQLQDPGQLVGRSPGQFWSPRVAKASLLLARRRRQLWLGKHRQIAPVRSMRHGA